LHIWQQFNYYGKIIMPVVTNDSPQAVKDMLCMFARRQFHNQTEHYALFQWKDLTYSSWILNLESLRPTIKYFGNKHDAFMFNEGEHFEELRQATMLEF
jgi:hypothetical protein